MEQNLRSCPHLKLIGQLPKFGHLWKQGQEDLRCVTNYNYNHRIIKDENGT